MLILLDKKMPAAAKTKLAAYGEIMEFATNGIIYEAISGHPDIFFCPTPAGLIVAPNLPEKYFSKLNQNVINYSTGQLPVGHEYPESTRYNTLITDKFIIQNPVISDISVNNLNPALEIIKVRQGYVRCNVVALPGDCFITSDRGIEKAIKQQNLEVLFVDPACVVLDGVEHGFFGGACGLHEKTLFLCGSLKYFKEQFLIKEFIKRAGIRIIELYDGLPVDVGTIMFLKNA
jgi:hypothetical protein